MAEQNIPNQSSNQEPAEGSRDTVNANVDDPEAAERYEDTNSQSEPSGGITNRPIGEELKEQRDLPPRGSAKPGGHAS